VHLHFYNHSCLCQHHTLASIGACCSASTLEKGAIRHANDTLHYRYYSQVLPPSGTEDAAILDMCSSWVSHYPKGYKLARIAGTYFTPNSCHTWHAMTARFIWFGNSGMCFSLTFRHDRCCHLQPALRFLTPSLHHCASVLQHMHI
jgi:hypothetical protein